MIDCGHKQKRAPFSLPSRDEHQQLADALMDANTCHGSADDVLYDALSVAALTTPALCFTADQIVCHYVVKMTRSWWEMLIMRALRLANVKPEQV